MFHRVRKSDFVSKIRPHAEKVAEVLFICIKMKYLYVIQVSFILINNKNMSEICYCILISLWISVQTAILSNFCNPYFAMLLSFTITTFLLYGYVISNGPKKPINNKLQKEHAEMMILLIFFIIEVITIIITTVILLILLPIFGVTTLCFCISITIGCLVVNEYIDNANRASVQEKAFKILS